MNRISRWTILFMALFLIINGISYTAFADHDKHRERKRYQRNFHRDANKHEGHDDDRKSSGHHRKEEMNPVNNKPYKEECGACHFTYQPELLPSDSWEKILSGLDDHFGEVIELERETETEIIAYLKANAANQSSAERAAKIMKSLGSQTPLRITQIPYIQRKHHEIKAEVLKRESIGSLSNCVACHKTAESGIYDDDNVVIPQ